jgi:uncharacterized membrane protein (DUF4010 family)
VESLLAHVPNDAVKIALVLSLSFLIGLEREGHKAHDARYGFGGVRTFPLIGLIGFTLALISGPQLLPFAAGLIVVGGFMLLSYWHKFASGEAAGITSEVSGLVTYLVGALVQYDHIWIATALTVVSVLLLELKQGLESLADRIPADEIAALAKFLLLSAVVLPVVPNESLSRFHINPFKTWLVVVAVSGISYLSYLLQKATSGRGGVLLSALIGGAYSSTVTTVVLSRQAACVGQPRTYSGAILAASGVMYLRLTLLVALFNHALLVSLGPPFLVLAVLAVGTGWLWSRGGKSDDGKAEPRPARNPLELGAAMLFAGVFVGVLVLTQLAHEHLGRGGLYSLAALMGVTDVDPFVISLTQTAQHTTPPNVAAAAILLAGAGNNVAKGVYALSFADRKTGVASFLALLGLAGLGLIPWLWV